MRHPISRNFLIITQVCLLSFWGLHFCRAQDYPAGKHKSSIFLTTINSQFQRAINRQSLNAWQLYPIASALAMKYELTSEKQLLEVSIEQLRALVQKLSTTIGLRDGLSGKFGSVWLNSDYSCNVPIATILHNALIITPYARIFRTYIARNPADQNARIIIINFATIFQNNLQFFEENFVHIDGGIAIKSPDISRLKTCPRLKSFDTYKILPLNMISIAGESYLELMQLLKTLDLDIQNSRIAHLENITKGITQYVISQMHPTNGQGLRWQYVVNGRPEDIGHAAPTVRFLCEISLYRMNWLPQKLISDLVETFHFVYADGAHTVRSHIDLSYGSRGNARLTASLINWAPLSRYDPTIFTKLAVLENWINSRKSNSPHIENYRTLMLELYKP